MNDLQLSEFTHDLVFIDGDLILLDSESEVARQALTINLLHYKGEWFLDSTYGVPYLTEILGKVNTTDLPDTIIADKVRESYNISSLDSLNSSISVDRSYIIDRIDATTEDGEIISITNTTL